MIKRRNSSFVCCQSTINFCKRRRTSFDFVKSLSENLNTSFKKNENLNIINADTLKTDDLNFIGMKWRSNEEIFKSNSHVYIPRIRKV